MAAVKRLIVWLVALCIGVLFIFFLGIPLAFTMHSHVEEVRHLWSWAALMSPCFYLYAGVTLAAVIQPFFMAYVIPSALLRAHRGGQFWVAIGGAILSSVIEVFRIAAVVVLSWGTFPFDFDTLGRVHLRLIPFFPWPSHPFWG